MTVAYGLHEQGPFFDGVFDTAVPRIVQEIEDEVAQQANADVHHWMNVFFRHPTPYYETQVVTQRSSEGTVVTDQGVIYGPWLNGTGSRNETTRFKGYPHWRLATQQAQAAAQRLADAVLARHERDLG